MCRKYTKILFLYPFSHELLFMPHLITAIYDIYIGEYDIKTWKLAFNLAVPFDNLTLWGWFLNWFLLFNMGIGYSISLISTMTNFMCGCIYVMAICENFNLIMTSIDDDIDKFRTERNVFELRKIHRNIHEKLIEAVVIHVKVLEWVDLELHFSKWVINSSLNHLFKHFQNGGRYK